MQATESPVRAQQDGKAVYLGTGRRKTAVARVRLVPGTGTLQINGHPGDLYLQFIPERLISAKAPLETLGLEAEYDVLVNVHGGGLSAQADAIRLGVARALCQLDPENRKPLKIEGYLTRDPRAKERKKYGLRKARKAPQYSKR
ncbi:30S ribosomal protein S9 [Leptolyngbya sp. FACHB-261]|uniref:30S ribosomal protein S9 n=1 Tax=Leptolyngbya sp. FACHB-261 TaxID=2692806 RepID=UPI0016846539|nr:30S ribosomal protein S9 [Leptolyngbya sp. FACHB-261]MBD2105251.1 30S ribosomal protein S9 [Leptolyngbya sp. FACHB-261]